MARFTLIQGEKNDHSVKETGQSLPIQSKRIQIQFMRLLSDGSKRSLFLDEFSRPVSVDLPEDVTSEEWDDLNVLPILTNVYFKMGATRDTFAELIKQPWLGKVNLFLDNILSDDLDLMNALAKFYESTAKAGQNPSLSIAFKKYELPTASWSTKIEQIDIGLNDYGSCLNADFTGFQSLTTMSLYLPRGIAPKGFLFRAPPDLKNIYINGGIGNLFARDTFPSVSTVHFEFADRLKKLTFLGFNISFSEKKFASIQELNLSNNAYPLAGLSESFPNVESFTGDFQGEDVGKLIEEWKLLKKFSMSSETPIAEQTVLSWYQLRDFEEFSVSFPGATPFEMHTFRNGQWEQWYNR